MSESSPVGKRKRHSVGSSHRAQVLQDEAHEDLVSDLEKMVNQDDYGDVVFICKDQKRVKAIRLLLVGRCDVLKEMLANGMREASLSEVILPDVSSQALQCVFEFLYTGTIVNSQPKMWRLLFDVVVAAQFFLLQSLVGIVLELILDTIAEVAKDLPEVAAMLTRTFEFSHSCVKNECDPIIKGLVGILSSSWTNSVYVANLSEEALHYLLIHTKAENNYELVDDKNLSADMGRLRKREPSLTEYYRFRQVILWWVYQNVPGWSKQVEEKVESAVPLIRDQSSLYFNVDIGDETTGTHSSLHLKSLLKASKDAATRLLSAIDLRYMHFILFEKVVRPLNCFPSSDNVRLFRFHSLNNIARSVTFINATCEWKHSRSLSSRGDGSSIENRGSDKGAAIALMRMSKKTRIHLWRFVIEEDVETRVDVGFIFLKADQLSGWDAIDSDDKTVWDLTRTTFARAVMINGGSTGGSFLINLRATEWEQIKGIDKAIHKGSHVLFQLDFVERKCSLNLDGDDFGICWKDLPDEDCYPAVSFEKSDGLPSGLISIQTPRM